MESFCPYKELNSFSEEDHEFFFGREADQETIAANLVTANLTVLYGASGVGKTSVLQAGVVPFIKKLPNVTVVVFRTWHDQAFLPLLNKTIVNAVKNSTQKPFDYTNQHLDDLLEQAVKATHGTFAVIFDQFEEYFLYHPLRDQKNSFDVQFARAVNRRDIGARFLLSIREDSLSRLDRFQGRIPNLLSNYLRIDHLSIDSARAAVEKPIEKYNLLNKKNGLEVRIEPALIEKILDEVQVDKVALGETGRGVKATDTKTKRIESPFLQLVMTSLWQEEHRQGSKYISLETLKRLDGVEHIVHAHLDKAMSKLSPVEQEIGAEIFHHLVTPAGSKIAHTAFDLAAYSKLSESLVEPILEKLSTAPLRILRPLAPTLDHPQKLQYEIFHDVLAPGVLHWRTQYVQAKERAAAQEKLKQEKRRVNRYRLGIAGLVLLALIMLGLLAFALHQRYVAEQATKRAADDYVRAELLRTKSEKQQLEAERLRDEAQASRVEADDARSEAEVERDNANQMLDVIKVLDQSVPYFKAVMRGHTDEVYSAEFSPDGKLILTQSEDGTARVWEANDETHVIELHNEEYQNENYPNEEPQILSAKFSPDGKSIVTANSDCTATVWKSTGEVREVLYGHTADLNSVSFSSDGELIITASNDSTVRIWSFADDTTDVRILRHKCEVENASFSPNGNRALTISYCYDDNNDDYSLADEYHVCIWDIMSGRKLVDVQAHAAEFNSDGNFLVIACEDSTAKVIKSETGEIITTMRGQEGGINSVAFSPDDAYVITSSEDGTARVWLTESGESIAELYSTGDAISLATFSPDGRLVVTGGTEGTALVWSTESWEVLARLRGHIGAINSAEFSPNSKLVATASADKTARVWVTEELKAVTLRSDESDEILEADFSCDGSWIITRSMSNTIRIWDTETGKKLFRLEPNEGDDSQKQFSKLSPDGKLIVISDEVGVARVCELRTGRILARLHHNAYINDAIFSNASTLVLTVGVDSTAKIWGAMTGDTVGVLSGHKDEIIQGVFSADDSLIMTKSLDGVIRVFDAISSQQLFEFNTYIVSPVDSEIVEEEYLEEEFMIASGESMEIPFASFSADGRWIVSPCTDSTARIWDVNNGLLVAEFRGHSGDLNSARFNAEGNLVVTASDDGTARIWDVVSGHTIATLSGKEVNEDGENYVDEYIPDEYNWENPEENGSSHSNRDESKLKDAFLNSDGNLVLTISTQGIARVWNLTTGHELTELDINKKWVDSAKFSPNGKWILTVEQDGVAHIWELSKK